MPSQPITDTQSQAALTTVNLIQEIYIPVLFNLLNLKKARNNNYCRRAETANSQPDASSYEIHCKQKEKEKTSTSFSFHTSSTKSASFLKSMNSASSIIQIIES